MGSCHSSFKREYARMFGHCFIILGVMILLGGRTAFSITVTSNPGSATNLTIGQNQKNEALGSTDQAIRNVLVEITNRLLRPDDSHLIALIKKGIAEAARSAPSASIEAGAKKAQSYVTDVTAAYTLAIFRAGTPQQARDILHRFQDTIRRIVGFAKKGEFTA